MFSRLRRSISRASGRSPHKYTTVDEINQMSDIEFSKMKVKDIQCKNIVRNIEDIQDDERKVLVQELCEYKSRNPNQRGTSIKVLQSLKSNKNSAKSMIKNMTRKHYNTISKQLKTESNLQKRLNNLTGKHTKISGNPLFHEQLRTLKNLEILENSPKSQNKTKSKR